MTRLLINIDHIATLRNARKETFPDPVLAARECEAAGADGIVFHLREDRRHITDADVARLKESVTGKLDFELSLAPEIVSICVATRPDLATLVPERREEVTTEGGLDVLDQGNAVKAAVHRLRDAGIPEVSLFMDPDPAQIEAVPATGANVIELHTGAFANAPDHASRLRVLEQLADAARLAHAAGLRVHAGHGLDYTNWPLFAQHVPHVQEVSIGFAIISRALFTGLRDAVADMRRIIHHSAS
ncbi:MAG: pyridoxine 5'-phosphate synthase [Rhodothermales bacterium]